jgi:integrase
MAYKTNYKKGNNKYFRTSRTIGYDQTGKAIRKEFYGKGEKEANKKADDFIKMINDGLNLDLAYQKLYDAMKIWLFEVKKKDSNNKETTFARYESSVRNMLLITDNFANMKVVDIKSIHVQRYVNMKATDYNKTYDQIEYFLKILKMFFKYATEEGYTLKNPTKNIKNPGKKDVAKKYHEGDVDDDDNNLNYEIFTDEEINAIIAEMEKNSYRFRFFILLALSTGLRKGELLGLKYIDIRNGFIFVNRTLSKPTLVDDDGKLYSKVCIWEPKSVGSIRIIPFPTKLIEEFNNHRERHLEEYKSLNIIGEPDFVFESEPNKNLLPDQIYRSYNSLLKRAGVKKRRLHALRHTFATRHIRIKTDLITLKELLGHSDISMTMKYVHISKEDMINAMNQYDDTFL